MRQETERLKNQWHSAETAVTLPAGVGEIDLFDRQQKKQPNDADRLRKYLARFNLSREQITGR
ncbi:hypothetical protein [Morganella morganii]|uniref:hypothetical protein n=1 Tax=Morganella morganii TaxID=582 RepID=UPI003CD0C8DC